MRVKSSAVLAVVAMMVTVSVFGQRFIKVFDNIQALVASNPNDVHTNVFVVGWTNINDGGGGIYTWISTSTAATQANFSVLKANGQTTGRWVLHNGSGGAGITNFFDYTYITNLYVSNLYVTNLFLGGDVVTNVNDNWKDEGPTNSTLAGIAKPWKAVVTNSVEVGQAGEAGEIEMWSTNGTYTVIYTITSNGQVTITPTTPDGTAAFVLQPDSPHTSAAIIELKDGANNIVFNVLANSGWTGTGTNVLTDAGFFTNFISGTVVNPTDFRFPYRSDATSFADGQWNYIVGNTNALGFNSTNFAIFIGDFDVALGHDALGAQASESASVAVGKSALAVLNGGSNDEAIGFRALFSATTASENVAVGLNSLLSLATGENNVGVGNSALLSVTGDRNTAIGSLAGRTNTASANIFIGYNANPLAAADTNTVVIGYGGIGHGDNTITIGNPAQTQAIFQIASYTGTGTAFLSDDGTYKSVAGAGGVTANSTNTFTNKTYDTSDTGNIFTQRRSIKFQIPRLTDGSGCMATNTNYVALENFMVPIFNGTSDTNANYCYWITRVPEDFDSNGNELTARLTVTLGGTNSNAANFTVGMSSVANGAAGLSATAANYNSITITPTSAAAGDVESSNANTLTGWKSNMTANQFWKIQLQRVNNSNDDAIAVQELEIFYDSTQ